MFAGAIPHVVMRYIKHFSVTHANDTDMCEAIETNLLRSAHGVALRLYKRPKRLAMIHISGMSLDFFEFNVTIAYPCREKIIRKPKSLLLADACKRTAWRSARHRLISTRGLSCRAPATSCAPGACGSGS